MKNIQGGKMHPATCISILIFLVLSMAPGFAVAKNDNNNGENHGLKKGHYKHEVDKQIPELNPGVAGSAVALLVGGLLILLDRPSRKG